MKYYLFCFRYQNKIDVSYYSYYLPLLFLWQAEEKKKLLRKHPFFRLTAVIASGKDLLAMDRGGELRVGGVFFPIW